MVTHQGPVDLIAELVQPLGLEVIEYHNGLVFVTNNDFILQSTDKDTRFDLYFNEDIEEEKAQTMMALLEGAAEIKGLAIVYKGAFSLTAGEEDQVELAFFDLSEG